MSPTRGNDRSRAPKYDANEPTWVTRAPVMQSVPGVLVNRPSVNTGLDWASATPGSIRTGSASSADARTKCLILRPLAEKPGTAVSVMDTAPSWCVGVGAGESQTYYHAIQHK